MKGSENSALKAEKSAWKGFHNLEGKPIQTKDESVRSHNVGKSDYSKHKIQPWDIWIEYKLNAFDGDIIKRVLRQKEEKGMSKLESRKLDYQKIIHICQERIRQIDEGIEL